MPGHQSRIKPLAEAVGSFISYWGFRGIHGQIWTLVWLAKSPVSGADATRALGVSKALVSPALAELEEYGLIFQVVCEDARAKRYAANPDVFAVIEKILRSREAVLLNCAEHEAERLKSSLQENLRPCPDIDDARLETILSMIQSAQTALRLMTSEDGLAAVSGILGEFTKHDR